MSQKMFRLRSCSESSAASVAGWLALLCLLAMLSPLATLAQDPPPNTPPEEPPDEWDEIVSAPISLPSAVEEASCRGSSLSVQQGTLALLTLTPPRESLRLDGSETVTVTRQPEVLEVEMARDGWLTLADDVQAIVLDAQGHVVGHLADGPLEVGAGRYFLYLDAGGQVRLNVEVD